VLFLCLEPRETDKNVLKFSKSWVLKFHFLLLGALHNVTDDDRQTDGRNQWYVTLNPRLDNCRYWRRAWRHSDGQHVGHVTPGKRYAQRRIEGQRTSARVMN